MSYWSALLIVLGVLLVLGVQWIAKQKPITQLERRLLAFLSSRASPQGEAEAPASSSPPSGETQKKSARPEDEPVDHFIDARDWPLWVCGGVSAILPFLILEFWYRPGLEEALAGFDSSGFASIAYVLVLVACVVGFVRATYKDKDLWLTAGIVVAIVVGVFHLIIYPNIEKWASGITPEAFAARSTRVTELLLFLIMIRWIGMRETLEQGVVVVFNRYLTSTLVHSAYFFVPFQPILGLVRVRTSVHRTSVSGYNVDKDQPLSAQYTVADRASAEFQITMAWWVTNGYNFLKYMFGDVRNVHDQLREAASDQTGSYLSTVKLEDINSEAAKERIREVIIQATQPKVKEAGITAGKVTIPLSRPPAEVTREFNLAQAEDGQVQRRTKETQSYKDQAASLLETTQKPGGETAIKLAMTADEKPGVRVTDTSIHGTNAPSTERVAETTAALEIAKDATDPAQAPTSSSSPQPKEKKTSGSKPAKRTGVKK